MPNILIGALGDHPAVITSAVKALAHRTPPIHIDAVHVLYSDSRTEFIGQKGVAMIAAHLHPVPVYEAHLPFADANSVENSIAFLQRVNKILDSYRYVADAELYFLLAGGRKNMAALLALSAPFYSNVRAMYHLLDKREGTPADVFASLELIIEGVHNAEAVVRASLDQPLTELNLIEIPYPGPFADPALLKDAVQQMNAGGPPVTLPQPVTPEAVLFYAEVQEPESRQKGLEVWLSQTAADQHYALAAQDPALAKQCLSVMGQMTNAKLLKSKSTQPQGVLFRMFRSQNAGIHPVFLTKDTHIQYYPNGRFDRVVVCALAAPVGTDYEPSVKQIKQNLDDKPVVRLAELGPTEHTLVVPLGKSPMVAAQTYVLLTESEDEGRPTIATVALVYPGDDSAIRDNVKMLTKMFEERGVEVCKYKVEGRGDLDSVQACSDYFDTLRRAIRELRAEFPHRQIDLSLSGGRKGMSALALFAAQAEGIDKVYHTLITDPKLEDDVEEETSWKALRSADYADRVSRLFLDAYAAKRDKFVLFPVPVIPFAAQDGSAL